MQTEEKRGVRSKRGDVAKVAGVSEATVSYVLNGTKRVSSEVEKRVLEASKELHYTPNRIAQSLAGKRTNSIAILTDDITDLYQLEVIKGVQAAAMNHDFIVYIFDTSNGVTKYIDHIISRKLDGVFVIPAQESVPDALLEEIRDAGIRVLADDERAVHLDGVSYLCTDYVGGFEQIIDYLWSLGHRDIAYLSAAGDPAARMRMEAFRLAADRRKEGSFPSLVGSGRYTTASECGEELMQKILKDNPSVTAVVCTNDTMAFGVVAAIQAAGMSIPKDFSIIGVDNIQQNDMLTHTMLTPHLTTLNQGGRGFGHKIFDLLYRDIIGSRSDRYVVPLELILRDSVAPPRKR